MPSKDINPTRFFTKIFSSASSASQSRPSVHFDNETLVSHPETIDSSLKRRLSSVASSSSPYDSRKRSIVLPLTTSVPDVYSTNPISPRKRRFSTISPPLHHDDDSVTPTSPRRRRLSSDDDSDDDNFSSSFPRTRKLYIIPPSINTPPPQICAQVNQRIRSTFNYPDFDFFQHIQHRSYAIRTQDFDKKNSECVTMLDSGVDDLLQRMFEKLPSQPDTSMNIDIKPTPGKGLGMFSRKNISNGESFLFEYPTVITPYVIGLSIGLSQLYADIFGRLSDPVFGELMDLSCSSLISGEEMKDVYEAIMRINALAIDLPVPRGQFSELNTHRAIFLQTSRCNHSCDPNARWEWDLERFSLVLTAVRPIKQGEEITIPYIAPNMTTKQRQQILSNYYGFNCLCPLCTLPDDTDTKRNIDSTPASTTTSGVLPLPSFEKWCLDPTFPNDILINAHIRALQSYQDDNNEHDDDNNNNTINQHQHQQQQHHLDIIAMCYGALEDVDNFRIWMEHASEARLKNNNKPEHKLVFKKWLSNPTCFPVWGWRRAFCGEEWGEEDSDAGLSVCVSMGMFDSI